MANWSVAHKLNGVRLIEEVFDAILTELDRSEQK